MKLSKLHSDMLSLAEKRCLAYRLRNSLSNVEIADKLGVSGARITQIFNSIKKKLSGCDKSEVEELFDDEE